MQKLYDLDSRRVLVTGIGPLGCVPGVLATRSTNGKCAEEPQLAAEIFNKHLLQLIKDLNQDIGSDVFVAVNAGALQNDFIHHPQQFDFVTSKDACCGQGSYNAVGLCTIFSRLCQNRSAYAFWDAFHPTERANKIIVESIMNGAEKFITPMNLSTILALDAIKY
ncbi:lipase [Lithospermum erythrorhizon]|uniref:Lipase n=1 Tax=Lithospermum erythrorhizon TaxID=34254 RepID=A0AAV3PYR5_LITER